MSLTLTTKYPCHFKTFYVSYSTPYELSKIRSLLYVCDLLPLEGISEPYLFLRRFFLTQDSLILWWSVILLLVNFCPITVCDGILLLFSDGRNLFDVLTWNYIALHLVHGNLISISVHSGEEGTHSRRSYPLFIKFCIRTSIPFILGYKHFERYISFHNEW